MASVIDTLERGAGHDGLVSAQVFLREDIDRNDLERRIEAIVDEAIDSVGQPDDHPTIGKISRLAKSFSLIAAPTIFAAIATMAAVVSILPSKIDDIYPKPTDDL